MSPDKIFLAFEHGFVAQASNIEKDANGNSIFLSEYNPVEYIRKDALLEWVKEKEQNAITNLVKLTYKTVIDKIESL